MIKKTEIQESLKDYKKHQYYLKIKGFQFKICGKCCNELCILNNDTLYANTEAGNFNVPIKDIDIFRRIQ